VGARFDDLTRELASIVHGQDQDLDTGHGFPKMASRFEAVHDRHAHVHDDDVGAEFFCLIDCLPSVACLTHHLKLFARNQASPNSLDHKRVVINQQNFDLRPVALIHGAVSNMLVVT
jgi:hypothetical protein